jgi:hypothetical protein
MVRDSYLRGVVGDVIEDGWIVTVKVQANIYLLPLEEERTVGVVVVDCNAG